MKKTNVTLRKKKLSNGKISLYLDFYPPIVNEKNNKATRREFLKLYLFENPVNQIQKISNSECLNTAQLIQIRRQNELRKYDIYSSFEKEQLELKRIGEESFVNYLKNLCEKKEGNNYQLWGSAIIHFENFLAGREIRFKDVTTTLIDDFKEYILRAKSRKDGITTLSQNTALSYHNKIKTTLKRAYKEGKLRTDVNASIDSIKERESQRNFLTLQEAKNLFTTPCPNDTVYRISKFSTLTGLRYSDIAKLLWSEVQTISSDGYYIRFRQKKTNGMETLPISDEAFESLGERTAGSDRVFKGLKRWDVDRVLPVWIEDAGIKKHITFHCFRHTFATLQISEGTDIFTLSKMLGHKDIKTTQIYTKILDEKKREASLRISLK